MIDQIYQMRYETAALVNHVDQVITNINQSSEVLLVGSLASGCALKVSSDVDLWITMEDPDDDTEERLVTSLREEEDFGQVDYISMYLSFVYPVSVCFASSVSVIISISF